MKPAMDSEERIVALDREDGERPVDVELLDPPARERRGDAVDQTGMLAPVHGDEVARVVIVREETHPERQRGRKHEQNSRDEDRRGCAGSRKRGRHVRLLAAGAADYHSPLALGRWEENGAPVSESLKRKQELFSGVEVPEQLRRSDTVVLKPCALCGARDAARIYSQAHFPVVRCHRCGLMYADEHFREPDLAKFYSGDYYQRAYVCHPREIDRKIARGYVRAFQSIDPGNRGGSLLDFGSARGTFLAELLRRGYGDRWKLLGLDINSDEVNMGIAAGLPIVCADLADAALPEASFDAITAFSVLEHMQKPMESLLALTRLLKPGGELLVVIPDGDCLIIKLALLASRLLGDRARSFTDNVFHEEHLYYLEEDACGGLPEVRPDDQDPPGAPSYLETHPTSFLVALGAWGIRAASFLSAGRRCWSRSRSSLADAGGGKARQMPREPRRIGERDELDPSRGRASGRRQQPWFEHPDG